MESPLQYQPVDSYRNDMIWTSKNKTMKTVTYYNRQQYKILFNKRLLSYKLCIFGIKKGQTNINKKNKRKSILLKFR